MSDLFDFSQLDELMSADPEELRLVLRDLFLDFNASFAALSQKAANNLPDAAMEAHQLRGVSSSFGLKEVADLARELELSAGAGNLDRVLELIQRIRASLVQTEAELRVLRPSYFVD